MQFIISSFLRTDEEICKEWLEEKDIECHKDYPCVVLHGKPKCNCSYFIFTENCKDCKNFRRSRKAECLECINNRQDIMTNCRTCIQPNMLMPLCNKCQNKSFNKNNCSMCAEKHMNASAGCATCDEGYVLLVNECQSQYFTEVTIYTGLIVSHICVLSLLAAIWLIWQRNKKARAIKKLKNEAK